MSIDSCAKVEEDNGHGCNYNPEMYTSFTDIEPQPARDAPDKGFPYTSDGRQYQNREVGMK